MKTQSPKWLIFGLVCVLAPMILVDHGVADENGAQSRLKRYAEPPVAQLVVTPLLEEWFNLLDSVRLGVLPGTDCNTTGCVSRTEDDCPWRIKLDMAAGGCNLLSDPVDRHLCDLGIYLDGDVSDALAAGATNFVDHIPDVTGFDPGPLGDNEQPLDTLEPNGFNIGHSLILFVPDTDPDPLVDNSFLYIAWDISDFDGPTANTPGVAPVQFDADDNGKACFEVSPLALSDQGSEAYFVDLQLCADLSQYDPVDREPNDIEVDHDASFVPTIAPPIPLFVGTPPNFFPIIAVDDVEMFPTANINTSGAIFPDGSDTVNPTNGCIDRELGNCGQGNNIEMVIKRVESQQATFDNLAPRIIRYGLAQLVARTGSRADADLGDEEIASIPVRTSLPGIEVHKRVRCADSGDTELSTNAVALLGSTLGFEIVIENTGNETLQVTVTDVMQDFGSQAAGVICEPLCGSLAATLVRDGTSNGITAANAGGFGLNSLFFFDSCAAPDTGFLGAVRNGTPIDLGEMLGIAVMRIAGSCELIEGDVLRLTYLAVPTATDEVEFCADRVPVDCANSVSVSAHFDPPPVITEGNACTSGFQCDDGLFCNGLETCNGSGICVAGTPPCAVDVNCNELSDSCGLAVEDVADVRDTFNESAPGNGDDNSVTIDLLCREFNFLKEVGFPGFAPNTGNTGINALRVPNVPDGGFVDVEYRYSGSNTGEVTEDITITDEYLCADIIAAGASTVTCPICDNGGSVTIQDVAPGADYSTSCVVRFNDQSSLRMLIESDQGRVDCTDSDFDRYRNCASASSVPDLSSTPDICDATQPILADSFATIENRECVLAVVKEVRCLPDCTSSPDPGTPWVTDPDVLDVAGDACVQYRITVTNVSTVGLDAGTNGVSICALRITDDMMGSNAFASGPDNVVVQSPATCPDFVSNFNWEGVPVECELSPSLNELEQFVVLFEARLNSPAALDFSVDPRNYVRVEGIPDNECDGPSLFFSCDDVSSIGIDTRECDLELTKDVTCGDPRAAFAMFDPDLVDTLPGSTVGFRVQVTNTGEVSLPRITLTDVLDCDLWFIAGSVVADIDGADVTSCVCPGGVCNTTSDLNGLKDLAACVADGVPTNGVLTITFKTKVPDDFNTPGTTIDCTNTMTVQPETDVCADSASNPCPELTDDASINVDVPDVICEETICADVDTDGVCDAEYAPTNGLQLMCDVEFPIVLDYTFEISNTGEVPFASADACKDGFVSSALAAGIIVGPCDLCSGACDGVDDDCAVTGAIDTNGSVIATCELFVPDATAWQLFAEGDGGDPYCNTNSVEVTGNVDTTGYCAEGADTTATSSCDAEVCISPPCNLEVEKTFRCVDGCTDRTPVGADTNALPALPGATVEFEIATVNAGTNGDPAICSVQISDTLSGAFTPCSDFCVAELVTSGGTLACSLPGNALPIDGSPLEIDLASACGTDIAPGDVFRVRCAGEIPDGAAGMITNSVTVEGAPNCPDTGAVYCCEDSDAAVVNIDSCGFTVEKDVTCDDPRDPGATFDPDIVDALPGSTIGFRIVVTNTGDVALPRVDLTDALDCDTWFLADTVVADIDGTDATNCVCSGGACTAVTDLNGLKDLTACVPGGIPVGGELTITFKVKVPANFNTPGIAQDCENTITVEGFTDVCSDPLSNACPIDMDTAGINVLVPEIDCATQVCADINNDGDCDDAATNGFPGDVPFNGDIEMPCDVNDAYPIRLIYKFQVNNPGETPVVNAQSCNPGLVADAIAAGLTVDPSCALCDGGGCDGVDDDCANLGTIPAGGMAMATCDIIVPDLAAWQDFASRDADGDDDCYDVEMEATADVDTSGLCSDAADTQLVDSCGVQTCIQPPCVLDVSKDFYCIESCDDRTPVPASSDPLNVLPGAAIMFEIVAHNDGVAGDPSICSLQFSDVLTGPFTPCPDFCTAELVTLGGTLPCTLPANFLPIDGTTVGFDTFAECGAVMEAGDELVIRCAGIVPDSATGSDELINDLVVQGSPECNPDTATYCCDADTNAMVEVDTCAFELTKEVTCGDPRDPLALFDPDLVDALPGSTVGFRVQVTNTGEVPLTRVNLTDVLDCDTWFLPGTVVADIDGSDVTSCVCSGGSCNSIADLNGLKEFATCTPDAIPVNGVLTITFKVKVPDDFNTPGTAVDCTNEITVQPETDVCADSANNPCPIDMDTAGINVEVPEIDCATQVCADINNDGDCDDAASNGLPADVPFNGDIEMPCDVNQAYPIRLIYKFQVNNPGETPVVNAQSCVPDFVSNALAAGLTVDPSCALCNGACDGAMDDCVEFGTIPAGGMAMATCDIIVPSRDAWEDFAALDADGDDNCFNVDTETSADVDTTGLCDDVSDTQLFDTCGVQTCIQPPCVLDVSKDFYCIDSCTDRTPLPGGNDPLDVLPGAAVAFEIVAQNTGTNGDPSICSLSFSDTLSGPFVPCADFCTLQLINGTTNPTCTLPGPLPIDGTPLDIDVLAACGEVILPGNDLVLRCAGIVPASATSADELFNDLTVLGSPECDPTNATFCCDADTNAMVEVNTCALELTKDVTCGDPRDVSAMFDPDLVDTLPGSTVGFRVQVTNTGEVSLPRITLTDVLDCDLWFIAGSVVADIDGADVTSCVCPGGVCNTTSDLNGLKDLAACVADGVPTNGVLTITFKTKVPDDFNTPGTTIDCTNTMTVQPETDVCADSASNPCPELTDDASINVDVPDVICEETICADVDTDGVCDAEYAPTNGLQLMCDVEFPIVLDYTFEISNTGEVPFASADACKDGFVSSALAAGIIVGPCDLCSGACDGVDDDCAVTGAIDTNGSVIATCELFVPDATAWQLFAEGDGGDPYCNTNSVEVTGNVDTTGYCAEGADTTATSSCDAEVCISPPCNLEVEKTFRCVDGCTDRTPVGADTNALPALPGATVEFEIATVNAGTNGDPAICSVQISDTLSGAFTPCSDFCVAELVTSGGTLACSLPGNALPIDGSPLEIDLASACGTDIAPGDVFRVRCAGEIPDGAAGMITNSVTVEGAPNCPDTGAVYCCEDSDAAVVNIDSCGFTVEKDVTCDDPRDPGATFDPDIVDALPGSTIGFRIVVTNTGDVALPRVDLTDALDCDTWFLADTVVADIDGTDATNCVCSGGACTAVTDLNGLKDLTACVPGGIPVGGELTITFKVKVPANFNTPGIAQDCENTITVEGFTDVCSDPLSNACPIDMDTAGINVLVPEIDCATQVCADINNDGDCDDAATNGFPGDVPFNGDIEMPCDVNDAYPIRLIYKFQVNNPGETPVVNAQSCNPGLVADAIAAGLTVDPSCALCDGGGCDGVDDDCANLGTIPAGGMAMATCDIIVPDLAAWEAFANDGYCREVDTETTAEVDTSGLCSDSADTDLMSTCGVRACIQPPCTLEVTKEVRCIESCDDRAAVDLNTNALIALPGAAVEFEIVAQNTGTNGDPSICSLRFSDALTGPITPCPNFCVVEVANDSGTTTCPVSPDFLPVDGTPVELNLQASCGVDLEPGDRVTLRCAATVDPNASSGDAIENNLLVEGASDCPTGGDAIFCCEDTDTTGIEVNTCAFELSKQATCDDPANPLAEYFDHVDAFAASTVGFRIQVTNTGDVPMNSVQISESLSCASWFIPGSVTADIDGADVTSCICPVGGCTTVADLNGLKDLAMCTPDAIPTNGVLSIKFEVQVPDNFNAPGTPLDCTNDVTVSPHTPICSSPTDNPCGEESDEATINVNIPSFDCDKSIAADYGDDATFEVPPAANATNVTIPNGAAYPIRLRYQFELNNTGDSDLPNAKICDDHLVADALAAGIAVEACALCTGACDGVNDTCIDFGTVLPGATASATCDLVVTSQSDLEALGALNPYGDPQSYINRATASADVDTTGMCGAPPDVNDGECEARLNLPEPPLPPPCFPTTKANFTVWNQNEVKFTGMHRCVEFWDQQPFALYATLGVPNHFLIGNLQTQKGKAQIDGIASQVCDVDVDPANGPVGNDPRDILSVQTPLVGVAHKRLSFSTQKVALAGMPLVGMGKEEGYVRYDLGVDGGTERPDVVEYDADSRIPVTPAEEVDDALARVVPAGAPRANTSQKGSLLVFPKVELRWQEVTAGVWQLTQDTFIELTNDYPAPVNVQMYFVNGDKPLDLDTNSLERAHLGCNWGDVQISLTASEPTYWSAANGLPKGVSPFTVLDPGNPPGRPAMDGTTDRVLRGYILAWAVRYVNVGGHVEQHEIAWDHLSGRVTVVDYAIGDAWEYTPWAFQVVSAPNGSEPDGHPGMLLLDGIEYEAVPDVLLLDFYTSGSTAFSSNTVTISTETDLTLIPLLQDVRKR
ncbi:MAG: hypothetical protein H6817_05640 [Phycisphaerales bacterium]|nr:hypothetical protein [Phycisphaerales bacterium]